MKMPHNNWEGIFPALYAPASTDSKWKRSARYGIMLFLLLATRTGGQVYGGINEDARFNKLVEIFLPEYWKIKPVDALAVGYFVLDSVPFVPDQAYFTKQGKVLRSLADSLKKINPDKLSANSRTDYRMMQDKIESDLWYLETFREQEWNPAWYNVGFEYATILGNRHKSLTARLRAIAARLSGVVYYYQAAEANLKKPVKEHTELAIMQNEGTVEIFTSQIPDSIAGSGLSGNEAQMLRARLQVAAEAVRRYVLHLKEVLPALNDDNSRSFHIGKELYNSKFKFDNRSGFTAEEMYKKAMTRKAEVLNEMAKLARELWDKYLPGIPMPDDDHSVIQRVVEKVSLTHTAPDSFMVAIEKQIPELIAFINKKDLIWIDPSKPLVVRQTPAYMEGSGAGVTISAPGPYDPQGNTYYNVSPLTGYAPEQAESYLREYNIYTLQILNIHEAIPGHYTQLVYSNKSPGIIKSLFGNGAMVEGWAVYTERMMLEEGYGNHSPELWLMYYKWHLRSVCNTILDYNVHVQGWNEDQAIHFLTHDAFQEKAEAEGKWRRARLTQVQLTTYFTGYSEIYALREEMRKKAQGPFSLKQFHEQFLGYGSAPVKYIRELMVAGH